MHSTHTQNLVSENSTLKIAIESLNNGIGQIALVVDEDNKLKGVVTDGDIRRAFLKGKILESPIKDVMSSNPITLLDGTSKSAILRIIRENKIHHIPIVNKIGQVVKLFAIDDILYTPKRSNIVVIMAGGKGERLRPLTENCPKPMLEIKGKPILENILENCINAGFQNFYISVNYLKEHITKYFENGQRWGVKIDYLEENDYLGTCGCLSLLPKNINDDVVVMNGDIITDLDLDRLIRFHTKSDCKMTICSRSHRVRIPFAVLKSNEDYLSSFVEKPMYDYQVNAGVYALNPKCIQSVPANFYNMTDLMEQLISENQKIGVFPIHENWKDIGNPTEFEEVGGEWR